jgi:predicted nucleic acid-binding protein
VTLVLDSSITLARVFPDELTPSIVSLFSEHVALGAWVPDLWKIEVANVLSLSVRKGRMTQERRDQVLIRLQRLPITIDAETGNNAWNGTLVLADRHKLTVYDATYLELALRRSLPLATLDRDLRRAAQSESIPLLGI